MNESVSTFLSFFFLIAIVVAVIKLAKGGLSLLDNKKDVVGYEYKRKDHLMTGAEREFYNELLSIFDGEYYIFPQMQISRILDWRISGQNWRAALARIGQKSVDYVFCDKNSTKPLLVIELDDSTHDLDARKERDSLVNAIFTRTGLPIIRARDVRNKSPEYIKRRITEVINLQN
jgi:very-short-patch-repair endonuclease